MVCLYTHNMLSSASLKGVKEGYPLVIEATVIQKKEVTFDVGFVRRIARTLDWKGFHSAYEGLIKSHADLLEGVAIPSYNPLCGVTHTQRQEDGSIRDIVDHPALDASELEEEFCKNLHYVLFELDIVEGAFYCPETKRPFPIKDGILNMLVNEDESDEKRC